MAKERTLRVLCPPGAHADLVRRVSVIARYPAFCLCRATPADAARLARRYPVEDITAAFEIPLAGRRLSVRASTRPGRTRRAATALPAGRHHYLVQFIGPVRASWLRSVRGCRARPVAVHSDFTHVVCATAPAIAAVLALPFVRWAGHLSHADRIAPGTRARRRGLPRTRYLPGACRVEFFTTVDHRALRRLGLRVLSTCRRAASATVILPAQAREWRAALARLAAVHGVKMIRRRAIARASNDVAAGILGVPAPSAGDGGRGEVIAVCDTGLDSGQADSLHPDFAGRVAAMRSYPVHPDFGPYVRNPGADDGPADRDSGHGTHVAGSALGSGKASDGLDAPVRGMAPRARLVLQAVEQELQWKDAALEQSYGRFLLAGIPDDLADLFSWARARGARIHSNSWGGGDPGAYDAQCEQLDRYVWQRRDFCIVVAAGNDGSDADGDGRINPGSVTAPGTAKNCVTVGACESVRPQFRQQRYGSWWPLDYPAPPLRDDPMADDAQQLAAFSSRGPTADGRAKPDVVAPGTFILSARSRHIARNNHAWSAFPANGLYFFMGGTSMATPLVAGCLARLREHLRRRAGIRQPGAALLKAALVLGARRLPGAGPAHAVLDHAQGFGRVDLAAVIAAAPPARTLFVDEGKGLRTGESAGQEIEVNSGAAPLRIVLAYTDYPGPTLVNDLNLLVHAPDGRIHAGNGAGRRGLVLDARNNVEVVHVARPARGRWRIQVLGANVPEGAQSFALALAGAFTATG